MLGWNETKKINLVKLVSRIRSNGDSYHVENMLKNMPN